MDTSLPGVDVRLAAALGGVPSRIPVLLGPCGSGRTSALRRLAAGLGPSGAQYIDFERVSSTPERFLAAVTAESRFSWPRQGRAPSGPGEAFGRALEYFCRARAADGAPATFLLDEALEIRLFESFPGVSGAMAETLAALAASPNHFVLATRFESRALRALRSASDRFLVVHVPPVAVAAVAAELLGQPGPRSDRAEESAREIVALTDGRAAYVDALVAALADAEPGAADTVAALERALRPGGTVAVRCRYSYEIRLQRARGYGALKGVLGVLAEEEPLTLTEISLRLQRSPGSTRDYLGWLEDVDLVRAHRKRYAVADPVLRLWIRLHEGCDAPDEERAAAIVRSYAAARLSAGATPAA